MTSIRIQSADRTWSADTTEGARVFRIGRDESADIVTTDPAVSRRHAEIRALGEGWEVVDVGSSLGTWVNGRRVDRAPLVGTTAIGFGDQGRSFQVTVTVTPAAAAPAPPPPRGVPARRVAAPPATPPRRPGRARRPYQPPQQPVRGSSRSADPQPVRPARQPAAGADGRRPAGGAGRLPRLRRPRPARTPPPRRRPALPRAACRCASGATPRSRCTPTTRPSRGCTPSSSRGPTAGGGSTGRRRAPSSTASR